MQTPELGMHGKAELLPATISVLGAAALEVGPVVTNGDAVATETLGNFSGSHLDNPTSGTHKWWYPHLEVS